MASGPTETPDAAMFIGGSLWVDARQPFEGNVLAFINGVQCGEGQVIFLPDSFSPDFYATVRSAAEQPGCGTAGDTVTITLDGREMNERVEWQPGFRAPVRLVAGPPFAIYHATLLFDQSPAPRYTVIPYIDGVVCGDDGAVPAVFPDQPDGYQAVVLPDELRPGCGRDSVTVTLMISIDGQPEFTLASFSWDTEDNSARAPIDLTTGTPVTARPTATVSPG
jgi:hypothetical protein